MKELGLPTAYCLLPTADYRLLTRFTLHPSRFTQLLGLAHFVRRTGPRDYKMSGGHFARGTSLSRGPMKKYWGSSELSMLGLAHFVRRTGPNVFHGKLEGLVDLSK